MNFISEFLKQILDFIYGFVGNYGWSIVLFTLFIRIVLLPLDIKSKQSMRRMNAVQPKMQALQKKYANDKEKLNVKMNELYKQEKVSPMSGCLPMLIQLPILFCMFTAMRVAANEHTVQMLLDMMNGVAPTFQSWLWIKNVFMPDSFMSTVIPAIGSGLQELQAVAGTILTEENIAAVREFVTTDAYKVFADQFGASTFVYSAPVIFSWYINIPTAFNGLFILPLFAGFSQYVSTKMTQSATPQQAETQQANKMMAWFFPLFSVYICATYNAAFSIYWVAVNLIQMGSQYLVNLYFDKKDAQKSEEVIQR